MSNDAWSEVLAAWGAVVGREQVWTDAERLQPYRTSVCGTERSAGAVVLPGTTEEVQGVVVAANRHGVPLYPISRGCNWGMGSRLPVQDGGVVLDLRRMDRIREVHREQGYAVVEPGVTQRQLFDHLRDHRLPFLFNVTGSTGDSSLLGNALDRGVGYFQTRWDNLSALEVVLGNGRLLRTGFGHWPGARTAGIYRHGVGPSLDGLFAQSSFGVVTAAAFELIPRPPAHAAMILKIAREERLAPLIDALAGLRANGLIATVMHVANRERTWITMAPLVRDQLLARGMTGDLRQAAEERLRREGFGPWSAVAGLMGTPAQLRTARREIRWALRGIARVSFLTDRLVDGAERLSRPLRFIPWVQEKRTLLQAMRPLYGMTRGEPTDAALKGVYWPAGDEASMEERNPDLSRSGLIYVLPVLPAIGAVVREVSDRAGEIFQAHGFPPCITYNYMDARALEGVISVAFDRGDPEATQRARACISACEEAFMRMGYPPYRLGIEGMARIASPGDPFWQTVAELKRAVDPNGIIAPGRYGTAGGPTGK